MGRDCSQRKKEGCGSGHEVSARTKESVKNPVEWVNAAGVFAFRDPLFRTKNVRNRSLATRISSEVRHGIMSRMEPRAIVQTLREFVAEYFQDAGLFLSFVAARIDFHHLELTWSGAGHPSPLLLPADGREPEHLASQNPLIGVDIPGFADVSQETVTVRPSDRLFLFTGGLFEVADRVFQRIQQYQHGPDTDDQTLIVAEVR